MKVLLVDDDASILAMMARLFAARGHEVETCHGPFGASARALRAAPDVVLLDVMMPGLDGGALGQLVSRLALARPPLVVLWSADDDALTRVTGETGLPTLSKRRNPLQTVEAIERMHEARESLRAATPSSR